MKVSIREVLFPTDFSEPARQAQKYAVALAESFGARLHLMHVIAPIPATTSDMSVAWSVPMSDPAPLIEAARNDLATELGEHWMGTHPVVRVVEIGFAVDEIVKYAKKNEIDIIVVGTHGHTGLSHLLLGSVAEKLVRLAECPVLTVHPKGHQFVTESKIH